VVDSRVESWFGISVAPTPNIEGPRYLDADSFTVRRRELWASWESRDRREGWTSREHALYLRHHLHRQLELGAEAMLRTGEARPWATPDWLVREIEERAREMRESGRAVVSMPMRSGMSAYHAAVDRWTQTFLPPPLIALRDECDDLVRRGAKYGITPSLALDKFQSFSDLVHRAELEAMAPSPNFRCVLVPWRRRRKRRQLKRSASFKAKKRGRKRR
jgi:hypothetical protein